MTQYSNSATIGLMIDLTEELELTPISFSMCVECRSLTTTRSPCPMCSGSCVRYIKRIPIRLSDHLHKEVVRLFDEESGAMLDDLLGLDHKDTSFSTLPFLSMLMGEKLISNTGPALITEEISTSNFSSYLSRLCLPPLRKA